MNAYGPQDWPIDANKVVFDHASVDVNYIVSIDLKLSAANLDNEKPANIYGLTDGAAFGNAGSEIPAVYLRAGSLDLEVCNYVNGERICTGLEDKIEADVWFNLKIEQSCWVIWPQWFCFASVLLNGNFQFFLDVGETETWNNVEGIIGNTYDQEDIIAALGRYRHFYLNHSDDPNDLSFTVDVADLNRENAVNFVSTGDE